MWKTEGVGTVAASDLKGKILTQPRERNEDAKGTQMPALFLRYLFGFLSH